MSDPASHSSSEQFSKQERIAIRRWDLGQCKMWSRVITSYFLSSLLLWQLLCEEPDLSRVLDEEADQETGGVAGLLSRVLGLPGVWWPHTHIFANGWSLLAAGISSAVVGASFLPQTPQTRRSDTDRPSERVFRGVVAKPHSWPWIAKLKVTRSPAQAKYKSGEKFSFV